MAYSCAVMERQRGVSGHGGALARVAVHYIWLSDNLAHTILTPFLFLEMLSHTPSPTYSAYWYCVLDFKFDWVLRGFGRRGWAWACDHKNSKHIFDFGISATFGALSIRPF